jgi:hypothetical protein
MPIATPQDLIRTALEDLNNALKLPPTGTPVSHLTPTETEQLKVLSDLLKNTNEAAVQKPEAIDLIEQPLMLPKSVRFSPEAILNTKSTLRSHTKYPRADLPIDPSVEAATPLRVEPTASPPIPAPRYNLRSNPIPDPVVPAVLPAPPLRVDTLTPEEEPPQPIPVITPERPSRRNKKHKAYFAATSIAVLQATKLLDEPEEIIYTIELPTGYAFKAVNPDTGLDAEYRELLRSSDGLLWEEGMCHEIGRLFQGYKATKGTDTCRFIHISEMPGDRTATYVRIVVADKPRKAEPRRVRMTVGGDKVDYPGQVSTKTTDLITAKILFNSVLSTALARFMCIDLKDFYLNNILPRKEYIRIPVALILIIIIEL